MRVVRSIARRRGAEDRREAASEVAATTSDVVPGVIADVRLNGDQAVMEVRVTREQAAGFEQGAEVLLDRRPLWYVDGSEVGSTRLYNRLRPHEIYSALFVDDLPLAQRVADLLNEHGGPTDVDGQ